MFRTTKLLRESLNDPLSSAITQSRPAPDRRVIPISHASHMRGWHPVRPGHPQVGFESRLESRLISALALFQELKGIRSQPVTVLYEDGGARRRYTPDFFVELSRVPLSLRLLGFQRLTYVEVKPLEKALRQKDRLASKFNALRQITQQTVTLVTDRDIAELLREVLHAA